MPKLLHVVKGYFPNLDSIFCGAETRIIIRTVSESVYAPVTQAEFTQ
jgi:hypothetical protein